MESYRVSLFAQTNEARLAFSANQEYAATILDTPVLDVGALDVQRAVFASAQTEDLEPVRAAFPKISYTTDAAKATAQVTSAAFNFAVQKSAASNVLSGFSRASGDAVASKKIRALKRIK